jgi:hypothetical protein
MPERFGFVITEFDLINPDWFNQPVFQFLDWQAVEPLKALQNMKNNQ